jgi:hypothetical protein
MRAAVTTDGPDIAAVPRHKRTLTRAPASFDEPWAESHVDLAGNSYYSYRVGSGSPFGPGRGLSRRH